MMELFILGSPSALYILTINLALCLSAEMPTGINRLLPKETINLTIEICTYHLRFNVIIIMVSLVGYLNSITLNYIREGFIQNETRPKAYRCNSEGYMSLRSKHYNSIISISMNQSFKSISHLGRGFGW